MDGRLAAGYLQEVRLALARHQRVHHAFDLGERAGGRSWRRRIGEAHRAGEVARLVDVDQREAGVLLVVGAEAAVVGAAELGAVAARERPVARLDERQFGSGNRRRRSSTRLLDAVLGQRFR